MAASLPVICLDLGGPAQQISSEAGIKISAVSPDQVVEDLASSMHHLAVNPELRRRMGAAGRARAIEQFSWRANGSRMIQVYRQAIANSK